MLSYRIQPSTTRQLFRIIRSITPHGVFNHLSKRCVVGLVAKPTRGFKDEGAKGAALGALLPVGIGGLIVRPMHGMVLWADKVAAGHFNKHRKPGEAMSSSIFDEKLRAALTTEKGNRREHRPIVTVRLSNDEKQELKHRFENMKRDKNGRFVTEGTPPRSSPEASSDEFSSDEEDTTMTSVSTAYFKCDGTLKIEFENNEKDILSSEQIDALRGDGEWQVRKKHSTSIPKLNICILISGVREYLGPYLAVGLALKKDGHRIRFATHEIHKTYLEQFDLEFYPLGGDPPISLPICTSQNVD